MKRIVLSILSLAIILISLFTFVACDKFQGKTFEFASVEVTYITAINENGLVTATETTAIDDYCNRILGVTDAGQRLVKIDELRAEYGIVENYYKFSKKDTLQSITAKVDALTGERVENVITLSYELSGDAMQITRSELDENGCGIRYTERLEIMTSSWLQKYYWGEVNQNSTFTEEDITNHKIYRLVVNYMSY